MFFEVDLLMPFAIGFAWCWLRFLNPRILKNHEKTLVLLQFRENLRFRFQGPSDQKKYRFVDALGDRLGIILVTFRCHFSDVFLASFFDRLFDQFGSIWGSILEAMWLFGGASWPNFGPNGGTLVPWGDSGPPNGPKMVPNWSPNAPRRCQNGPKNSE